MRALDPVNRVLNLAGVPILRDVPVVNAVPGLTGLCNVVRIDFPRADELRLRSAVNPLTAAFIAPNHPEFYTDWMLDKEVCARVAPMAACWATNVVVNGMGRAMQRFWLANNLIAQIPGAGDEGKRHSIRWAKAGHGVLLHPEGNVGWHGDRIGHLFAGAVEMALQAARELREAGDHRGVFVAPVVWKLKLTGDVRSALASECAYVEKRLDLPPVKAGADPAERVRHAYDILLARDEAEMGVPRGEGGRLGERQARLAEHLDGKLRAILGSQAPEDGASPERLLRLAERFIRQSPPGETATIEARRLAKTLRRLRRFEPAFYPAPELTQEQVAESIKRLRGDYCEGSFRDSMNKLVPRPAGPRIAHIRVPEPIDIGLALEGREALDEAEVDALVAELKRRMQDALDRLNRETAASGPQIRLVNPFH
jgi:hypothetical protein